MVGNGLGATMSVLLGGGDGTFGAAAGCSRAGTTRRQSPSVISTATPSSTWRQRTATTARCRCSWAQVTAPSRLGPATRPRGPPRSRSEISSGDAAPDLVVANGFSASVSVLLGLGDGSFTAGPVLAVGEGPQDVTLGDLDGDSISDLMTANVSDTTLSILLGRGDGTFARTTLPLPGMNPWTSSSPISTATRFSTSRSLAVTTRSPCCSDRAAAPYTPKLAFVTGTGPTDVAIGDLDDHGRPDLAVANSSSGTVSVLLNAGLASVRSAPPSARPRRATRRRRCPGRLRPQTAACRSRAMS